jgi:hypothetical protein
VSSSGQFQSYDQGFGHAGANREDLLDIIVNIAPWDTPLFSSSPKSTARHTTHEWIEDDLAAATAWGAGSAEGADFSGAAQLVRNRLTNITMIFRKDVHVSETQRAVNPVGIKDEYAYQMSIAMKEIGRAVESRSFTAKASTAAGAVGTASASASGASPARLMRVLDDMIFTNTASAATPTKALLDSMIEAAFIAGGVPDRLFMHPRLKTDVAGALNSSNTMNYRNIAAADARLVGNVDVYVSNFGALQIVPDRFIPTGGTATGTTSYGRIWLLEQPKIRYAFLRPIKHVPLPPAGDAVRGMVLGELTLEVFADKAHAKAICVTNA